jgi:protein-disulfide isomerase
MPKERRKRLKVPALRIVFGKCTIFLYANQQLLDPAHLVGFAEELSLDTVKFVRELRDHVHHEHVREDFTSGVRSAVNGTPAFFINGFRYDGSWQFGPLLKALEDGSVDANAI